MIKPATLLFCLLGYALSVPYPDHLDDSPFFPDVVSSPEPTDPPTECENLMYSKGMRSNYGMAIAHRLHSLTVEDIL